MIALTVAALIAMDTLDYPKTKTVDVADVFHGVRVADPYRWLEQPASTPEVNQWIAAQNQLTFGFLDRVPHRDALLAELRRRADFEKFSVPLLRGGRLLYQRNDGLQNQSVLYVADSLDGEGRVLLDPNSWSSDGTVALVGLDLSRDGKTLLFAKSRAGSDWTEWRAMDVDSGKEKPDTVKWSKFGVGGLDREAKGFYYLRYPEPKAGEAFVSENKDPEVRYHEFGTPQSEDRLVFSKPDTPEWLVWPSLDAERETLWITIGEPGSVNNRLTMLDLTEPGAKPVALFTENDADYTPVHREGKKVWVATTKDAPRGRVVVVDVDRPQPEHWETVVPEGEDALQGVSFVGGRLFAQYLRDARSAVVTFSPSGEPLGEVALPGPGTASGFGGEEGDAVTFFSYTDLATPSTVYRFDIEDDRVSVYRAPKLPFDATGYETKQAFVTSKDGTRVPVFLVHRKGLKLDGTNPTLLYGYGGFGAAMQPWFSSSRTAWMDNGGVWALACIRGGSEYGKAWHEAAIKTKRQNAYDDFIACAEWLIAQGYTSPGRLAIQGGSNGGLLVGACMTQRPDLFAVAIPEVGVMDMLRFNQFTIGRAWEGDYGSPQNEDEFRFLYRISPYHALRDGVRYPATLVTTADTDDRVVPAHSFKFAARLQAAQAKDGPPVLIRIETSAGHGAGKPLSKQLEEVRDVYAFTLNAMGQRLRERY